MRDHREAGEGSIFSTCYILSYGADEYELGDLVIPAGEDQLLEKTAEAGDRILEDLGLSKDDLPDHFFSMERRTIFR